MVMVLVTRRSIGHAVEAMQDLAKMWPQRRIGVKAVGDELLPTVGHGPAFGGRFERWSVAAFDHLGVPLRFDLVIR